MYLKYIFMFQIHFCVKYFRHSYFEVHDNIDRRRISAWALYFQKLESLAYICVADSSGLQKFPEYISNSLSFPELQNSLRFPGFPDL